jgi:hypothetical protein
VFWVSMYGSMWDKAIFSIDCEVRGVVQVADWEFRIERGSCKSIFSAIQ